MSPKDDNKMGKWGATSYLIGNIIGSGIFISPNNILEKSASSIGVALVVWVISAIIATIGALCYVELGTRIRKSGADFAYLNYVQWNAFAFAFMCCGCVLLYPVILAIQAETFAEYLLQAFHLQFCSSTATFWAKKLISFTTIWLLVYLNFFSVQKFVAKFQILASFAKILSSAIIIATGLYILCCTDKGASNLKNPFENWTEALDSVKLTSAFYAGLFSYDGWDVLNFGVEDLKNPKSSLKFAIILGMTVVGLIFIAMNLSFFIVLNVAQIGSSTAVATTFAQHSLGSYQHIIPFLVSVVLIGSMNSTMFSASRYLFAASRAGAFPSFVSCINLKHDSPRAALFLHVIMAMCFAFLGGLDDLLDQVGFAQWIQRALTIIALLYIRYRDSRKCTGKNDDFPNDYLKTPLILPIIFLMACLLLVSVPIFQPPHSTAVIALGIILTGFAIYLIFIEQRVTWLNTFRNNSAIFATIKNVNDGMIDTNDSDDECNRADATYAKEKIPNKAFEIEQNAKDYQTDGDNRNFIRRLFRKKRIFASDKF